MSRNSFVTGQVLSFSLALFVLGGIRIADGTATKVFSRPPACEAKNTNEPDAGILAMLVALLTGEGNQRHPDKLTSKIVSVAPLEEQKNTRGEWSKSDDPWGNVSLHWRNYQHANRVARGTGGIIIAWDKNKAYELDEKGKLLPMSDEQVSSIASNMSKFCRSLPRLIQGSGTDAIREYLLMFPRSVEPEIRAGLDSIRATNPLDRLHAELDIDALGHIRVTKHGAQQ